MPGNSKTDQNKENSKKFLKGRTSSVSKDKDSSDPKKKKDSNIKVIGENLCSSSSSSELGICAVSEVYTVPQEHGRPKGNRLYSKAILSPNQSLQDVTTSITSITSSISRFRTDFNEFKCKMKIFGESLNLCKCIASDFKNKMKWMERRLDNLEKRHKLTKQESNYSTIIQKNKALSQKCLNIAKVKIKPLRRTLTYLNRDIEPVPSTSTSTKC